MNHEHKKLGKLPAKSSEKSLLFARYIDPKMISSAPKAFNFWKGKKAFPLRTFGNNTVGDCTRASQANAATRMERIECRRAPEITDEEVVRVYFDMTQRLYGGGDTGAYEEDALNQWRNPDYTFRDTKGNPLTIDAYTKINQASGDEIRSAIYSTGGHGIKVCFNLPLAWSQIEPPDDWDIPDGTKLIGKWKPASWGGHSMYASAYDEKGIWLVHTWGIPAQRVSWKAFFTYCDEAHWVVDSVDKWRKKKGFNIAKLISDVNAVSSVKIK